MKNPTLLIVLLLLLISACTARKTQPAETITPQPLPYGSPLIVAHRGARSVAPENTLLAAESAYELGANQWELDVQVSQDGELIVLHDGSLWRTTDAGKVYPLQLFWKAKNYTLTEIQALDAGSWYLKKDPFGEIQKGSLSPEQQDAITQAVIPTLRQALELTQSKGWSVNIELKDVSNTPGDAFIVQKTVALIEELGMVDHALISSFKHDYLLQVKALNPAIKTAALVDEMEDPVALLQSLGADAINPNYEKISDLSIIRAIRDAGYDVYVWTINDPQIMIQFINAGVSGIITDYPRLMLEVLSGY